MIAHEMTNAPLEMKFRLLTPIQRQEVADFIDFLLHRAEVAPIDKKRVLLNLSVWNDEDVQAVETVQKEINRWMPATF